MPPRLRFFRPKRRSKAIDFAKRGRGRLAVKLPALGEIGGLVEILSLKQRRGPFAGVRSKDRRVNQKKAPLIKKVAAGAHDFMPNPKNGVLAAGPKPQMTVFHQKADAVFFGLNRKRFGDLDRLDARDVQFVPAGRPWVLP